MKLETVIFFILVLMLNPAFTHAKKVQKRLLFLGKIKPIEYSANKLREILRDIYDPRPYEPFMLMEAKRVRARVGDTLANVTNSQLNAIVMALDRIYLDNEVDPALSKLVWDVRQKLGDKATYLTDAEIGDVIYDVLRQISPAKDVMDYVKVLAVAAPFLRSLGG